MFRKIGIILIISLVGSLFLSSALALRDAAIVSSSSARAYQYPSDSSRNVRVRKGTTVKLNAVKDGWAKVSCKGATGYMRVSALSYIKPDKQTSWKKKVGVVEWFSGGDAILRKGGCGFVYDIKSGQTIKVKRLGGHNHMDMEPARRSDGLKMKQIGASWTPRPAILWANGKYIACSINTQPHGNQNVKGNAFNGQFCLHMAGSKTHGGEAIREDHQYAIEKAYRWAHG